MGINRFICFSICLPESILSSDENYKAINEALQSVFSKLEPTDYVCVNIGNSRQRLYNDAQVYIEEYMRT